MIRSDAPRPDDAAAPGLEGQVLAQLDTIMDPCSVGSGSPMGLVEMGLIKSVRISDDGDVEITLRLTSPFCEMIGFLKSEAIDQITSLAGVATVTVHSDSGLDWSPAAMTSAARDKRCRHLALLGIPTPRPREPVSVSDGRVSMREAGA